MIFLFIMILITIVYCIPTQFGRNNFGLYVKCSLVNKKSALESSLNHSAIRSKLNELLNEWILY